MNKKQTQRLSSLLPNNEPKYVRIYDNGGTDAKDGSIDRYTVVFSGNYPMKNKGWHNILGMNGLPYWPQGFCQNMEYREVIDAPKGWAPAIGRKCHLGKRISFSELPKDCQHVVLHEYAENWLLPIEVVNPLMAKLRPSIMDKDYQLVGIKK